MVLNKGPLEITIVSAVVNGENVAMAGFYYIFEDGKVQKLGDVPNFQESYIQWKIECDTVINKIRALTMNESDKYKFVPLLLKDEEYKLMYRSMKDLKEL